MTPHPWTDTITVLQARGGKLMAKTLLPDGTFRDYDNAARYNASTVSLAGLDDVRAMLDRLIDQRDRCVVRGGLVQGDQAANVRRLVYEKKDTGDQPTLQDVPRRWLAVDTDSVERPGHLCPADLLACADVVLEQLPRPFARAAAIVQASAGHGIKPNIRLRLWYWCDRLMTGAELKRWLGTSPVDRCVFNPAQPIYTAAPALAFGVADPLPYRLIEYPGEAWLNVPSPEELQPPPKPISATVRPACVSGSARAQLYAEAALSKAHTRISGAKHRHPTILSEACGLARFVHAGLMSKSQLHDALWSAAQQAGKDDEAEIARMVTFGMEHPDDHPLPVDLRNG